MKLAFFDVDGTLSAPWYPDGNGGFVIGFTDEAWEAYCKREGADGYRYCGEVKCVKDYATKLHKEGCRLFVLSTIGPEEEIAAKRKFVSEHYAGLFEDFLFVRHDPDKITEIQKKAKKEGCALSGCVLVEDTYATLLKAETEGIATMHISHLMSTPPASV